LRSPRSKTTAIEVTTLKPYLIHVDEGAEEECEVLLHVEAQDLIPKELRLQPSRQPREPKGQKALSLTSTT
jgi:hypothetical protein